MERKRMVAVEAVSAEPLSSKFPACREIRRENDRSNAPTCYETLLGASRAGMIISDTPYNVQIIGHVSGLDKVKHPEFGMASGEMSSPESTNFLSGGMENMVRFSTDGSLHFFVHGLQAYTRNHYCWLEKLH